MAGMRGISKRLTLFPQQFRPTFSHIPHGDSDETKSNPPRFGSSFHKVVLLGSYCENRWPGDSVAGLHSSFAQPVGFGFLFCRYMSSRPEDWSDKFDSFGSVADEVVPEKIVEAAANQVPAINEVAIAAADSSFPVAALQYLIDAVHSFTGFNWWASIALTTLLLEGVMFPLRLELKSLNVRKRLPELGEEISAIMDPEEMIPFLKKQGAILSTPLKFVLIQDAFFVIFFLAIRNMAEKVPSFQSGGTLWFTNLSAPDSFYILPILMTLYTCLKVENAMLALKGIPEIRNNRKFIRVLLVASVPAIASFETAFFCYWLSKALFSLSYAFAERFIGDKTQKKPQVLLSHQSPTMEVHHAIQFLKMLKSTLKRR